jgi:transposase-like protein
MSNSPRFTIKDFNARYPDDNACLDEVFSRRYQKFTTCPECRKAFKYYKVSDRKCYACQSCGYQLHPLADTIFHKSSTPLKSWFYAIYLFSVSKNGVSAKELQRQLGVTYKCAWRIAKQVRQLFSDDSQEPLGGVVEVDETYIGGKRKNSKRGRGADGKKPVVGLVEREGSVRAVVTENVKSSTVMPLIKDNVRKGSMIMTDEFVVYKSVPKAGYSHHTVNHGAKEYVNGTKHTNTIEGFWSQLKRSVDGTYHAVSPKYLQTYVDEFAFRYNHRKSDVCIYDRLMEKVV